MTCTKYHHPEELLLLEEKVSRKCSVVVDKIRRLRQHVVPDSWRSKEICATMRCSSSSNESNTRFPYLSDVPEKKKKKEKNEIPTNCRLSKQMTHNIIISTEKCTRQFFFFLHQLRNPHLSPNIIVLFHCRGPRLNRTIYKRVPPWQPRMFVPKVDQSQVHRQVPLFKPHQYNMKNIQHA